MFGRLKHISFLLVLALGLSFALPAAAQIIAPESAAQFAKTHGGKEWVSALEQTKDVQKIICGSKDNLCDSATQVCLRCYSVATLDEKVLGINLGQTGKDIEDLGKCVSKENFDPENLLASWPECDPQSYGGERTRNLIISKQQYNRSRKLTLESSGFLSTNMHKALSITWSRDKHSFVDPSTGKVYNLVMNEKPTIQYGGDGGDNKAFKGCEVFPVKLYNMSGCFFCPLARLIFDAANNITIESFSYFASGLTAVIAVMFGIWLALAALQQVFSMTKQDAPKFLSAIVKQGFKYLLAAFLLVNAGELFSYFIVPVLDGGLAMGKAIQAGKDPLPDDYVSLEPTTPAVYFNSKGIGSNGRGLYQSINEYLTVLQQNISYMQAVGTTLFCVGSHELFTNILKNFKSGLSMMFLGAILTVFGFLLTISFGFYFMDAILQLAILGVMLPFMIAGWPFKATAQYASTGFKMLLNTFFVMFFTGFVVSVCMTLVDQTLNQTTAIEEADQENSGLEGLAEAFNEQNIEKVRELTDLGGSGFLLLIFACLFGFKFVGQVTPLAGKLASGGLKPLAGKIGTMAASATKGMAAKVTAPVRQGFNKATGGVLGIAAGIVDKTAGTAVRAVGKGLSKGGEALAKSGKGYYKAAGWLVNKAGKGISGVGNISKKVQQAYKDEANRPKK